MRKTERPPQTRLAFHAKMNGLSIRPAKEPSGTGRFELGLIIEQPSAPKPPSVPWEFAEGVNRSVWKPRPGDAAPTEPSETTDPEDEETRAAEPSAELERQRLRYDQARAAFDEAMPRYLGELAGYRTRVRSYAELCGIAAVFGNQYVSVIITPANQDILPGFAAELPDPLTEAPLELAPLGISD